MNQISNLNVDNIQVNTLSVQSSLTSSGIAYISSSHSDDVVFADNIHLGSHTFKAEQLGQLFNILISQYPELHL